MANKTALPDLSDVFKTHPQLSVLKDMISKYRLTARKHLQETMPSKILHLQALLESESDPNSPLYTGHVLTPAYTNPMMIQPTHVDAATLTAGRDVVLPMDVDSVIKSDDGDDHVKHSEKHEQTSLANGKDVVAGGRSATKGAQAAAHWFEVVPQNQVQHGLINLSVKEHEDLHMITQDLRIWLEIEIPLVEDGNSFGADVQAHLVRELGEAYKRSNAFQNGCRAHYTDRLKLAQDWVKFPNLMDYPAAIAASDRFDHFLLRSYLRSLLVVYGGLLTKFEKNWAKVINPKGSSSSGGMY